MIKPHSHQLLRLFLSFILCIDKPAFSQSPDFPQSQSDGENPTEQSEDEGFSEKQWIAAGLGVTVVAGVLGVLAGHLIKSKATHSEWDPSVFEKFDGSAVIQQFQDEGIDTLNPRILQNQSLDSFTTALKELELVEWRTGMVIGTSEIGWDDSTWLFELGTNSRFGHIGMVVVEEQGVFVYHEEPPYARKDKLVDFLARVHINKDQKFELAIAYPHDELSQDEIKNLVSFLRLHVSQKTPYNFNQSLQDGAMNCSEFVHDAFQTSRRDIGKPEPMESLRTNNMRKKFMDWSKLYKPDAFFISPASIIMDGTMDIVLANVPTSELISDYDILVIWKLANHLDPKIVPFIQFADKNVPVSRSP